MSLHPDLEAFLDLAQDSQEAGLPALHQMTPAQARDTFEQTTAQLRWTAPEDLDVQAISATARDGAPLALRLYRPHGESAPMPVLVYFHGGGFVVGSLDSHDGVCREFCRRTPCAVLSVAIDWRRNTVSRRRWKTVRTPCRGWPNTRLRWAWT